MWRARFGRGFGPVVRQTTKWNEQTRCSTTSTFSVKHFLCGKFPRFSDSVRTYFGKYLNRP
jgi:hypothetical protein